MNISTLRALFEAGLTDEQIGAVLGTSKKQEDAPDSAPEEKKEEATDLQQVLEAINGLTETIQASNLMGAKNKEPETVDDILASLLEAD